MRTETSPEAFLLKLTSAVRTYARNIRPRAQAELQWFEAQPSLQRAIEHAALATNSRGKRYLHQRRLKRKTLEQALDILLAHKRQLRKAESFDKVFQLVETALEDVFGVGELYVYDTSLRVGAKLGLFPTKVYLHAGTRVGARALGFDQKAKTLSRSVLPPALRALEPHEIEDMLCIFKDKFKDRTEKPPSACIQRSWCD